MTQGDTVYSGDLSLTLMPSQVTDCSSFASFAPTLLSWFNFFLVHYSNGWFLTLTQAGPLQCYVMILSFDGARLVSPSESELTLALASTSWNAM